MGNAIGTQIVSPEPTPGEPQQSATNFETPKPVAGVEHIPEKFGGSVEKMAAAYKELETKLGTPAVTPGVTPPVAPVVPAVAPVAPVVPAVEPTDPAQAVIEKAAADKAAADKVAAAKDPTLKVEKEVFYGTAVDTAMETAGLSPSAVANEWEANKALSEETYAGLDKAGYPRELVDLYIKGHTGQQAELTALQESEVAEVKKLVGGDEGYTRLVDWAGSTLTKGEIDSFNEIMDNGDNNMVALAVQGLQAKYEQTEGRDPTLVHGGGPGAGNVFDNHQQVAIAMKAAVATGDPAEVKAVEQKALRSPAL